MQLIYANSRTVWMEQIHSRDQGYKNYPLPPLLTKMIVSGNQDLRQSGGIRWLEGLVCSSLRRELSLSVRKGEQNRGCGCYTLSR